MPTLSSTWTQFLPPKATFTEKNVPDLKGKVYLVTGANTGIGKETARILYSKNATVYITARSEEKVTKAKEDIKNSAPQSTGILNPLQLDLSDLAKVKASAEAFLAKEEKLHVLFNNAGYMSTDTFAKTAQGYEMALGVNCVGTFLLTKMLTPTLVATAKKEPANTVRVVWLSSFGLELFAAKDRGVDLDNLDYHIPKPGPERYGISKTGDWALGVEFARRHRADGIVSTPINPGNLTSELARDQGAAIKMVARIVGYPPTMGAFTELYAGLSSEVTLENSGQWIVPFGRFYPLRDDLNKAVKLESEGGTGGCYHFWEWCEKQVEEYL